MLSANRTPRVYYKLQKGFLLPLTESVLAKSVVLLLHMMGKSMRNPPIPPMQSHVPFFHLHFCMHSQSLCFACFWECHQNYNIYISIPTNLFIPFPFPYFIFGVVYIIIFNYHFVNLIFIFLWIISYNPLPLHLPSSVPFFHHNIFHVPRLKYNIHFLILLLFRLLFSKSTMVLHVVLPTLFQNMKL